MQTFSDCDVSTDSNVHLTFAIQETLQLVDATLHSHQKCTVMEPSFCISLPPNDVLLLNDHVYHSALKIALMSYQFNEQRNYFVISSVAAFVVATSLGDVYDVQYIDHLMNRQPSLEIVKQVSLNQCGNAQQQCGQHSRPTLSYLLSEIVESTGVMNPDVLSEVALLR